MPLLKLQIQNKVLYINAFSLGIEENVLPLLTLAQTTHYTWTFSSMHILSNMNVIPSNRATTAAQLRLQSTVALLLRYGDKQTM